MPARPLRPRPPPANPASEGESLRQGGIAIIGTTADIDGFYPPSNHWDTNGFCYANAIYDPLTAVAADGSIQPYLAQSVTPNADKTVWNITLRPNITFSDGSALTATVLKNNLDALKASTLTGTALQPIESFDHHRSALRRRHLLATAGGVPVLPGHPGRLYRGPGDDRRLVEFDAPEAGRDRALRLFHLESQRPLHRHP